jgi:hypothetical protein
VRSGPWRPADEGRHLGEEEEWTFTFWARDGSMGGLVLVRLRPAERVVWYWSALARAGAPLVHVADWDVPLPATGLTLRSHAFWAEHICEAPFEQWTVANETYAVALDDPSDALGRAYGDAVPVAFDLEWYATEEPQVIPDGYEQAGEVHAVVELASGPVAFDAAPAHRTHRWTERLGPWFAGAALAHLAPRAPVQLPDGTLLDLVLTSDGWRRRVPR